MWNLLSWHWHAQGIFLKRNFKIKSPKKFQLLHSVVHQDVGATRVNGFRYLFWCVGRDICCGFQIFLSKPAIFVCNNGQAKLKFCVLEMRPAKILQTEIKRHIFTDEKFNYALLIILPPQFCRGRFCCPMEQSMNKKFIKALIHQNSSQDQSTYRRGCCPLNFFNVEKFTYPIRPKIEEFSNQHQK